MTPETRAYIQGYADCLARSLRSIEDMNRDELQRFMKEKFANAFKHRNGYDMTLFTKAGVAESTLEILRPYFQLL